MIPLPIEKTKNNCFYRQILRSITVAVYSLRHSPDGPIVGYEVFKIRIDRAGTLPNGTATPEKEHFPSNEDFGKIAWSFTTPKAAMSKAVELCPSIN